MSIIFKSTTTYAGSSLYPTGFLSYIARVKADGGIVGDIDAVFNAYRSLETLGISLTDVLVLVSPAFGYQTLPGGVITKLYNLNNVNDFTIVGTRAGTGPLLSTLNGYNEIVFAGIAGTGQRTLVTNFSATPFTYDSIYTAAQMRFDDPAANPVRDLVFSSFDSNTATLPRNPETLSVLSANDFDQITNSLDTAMAGTYAERSFYTAAAFKKVSPSTASRRKVSIGRIALVERLTPTGAFDGNAGFNGSMFAYSGRNSSYDQATGYGIGAMALIKNVAESDVFSFLESIE